jgi:hypothetical protein
MDDYTKKLSDGHIFWVITNGIRTMGSYASQTHPEQRWAIIKYIRSKQGGGTTTAATDSASATTAKPSGAAAQKDTTKAK